MSPSPPGARSPSAPSCAPPRSPLRAPPAASSAQRPARSAPPWNLAVGQDVFHPGAKTAPPTTVERGLTRFIDRAVATGARNPRALGALLDVMSLSKPAPRLFSPDMLIPLRFGPRGPHLQGPPLTDEERRSTAP
ncbi:hypothetical protein [Streptomyces sp. NPDC048419]|uniref:hypothetical protein n=1 Tax=Streptomyces sp. NPDC048419 TaxID=3365547 RepID=UPI003720CD4B